ncbi:MAG: DUF177 domain-containing protein [Candidatus Hydrogenedens sp.]|jgi:uncharacterized protein|nr:DUF177 domain-containing protein [Candidatus Hydrogenedens sp.]
MNILTIPISSISVDGYEYEECTPVESIQPPDTQAVAVDTVSVSGRFTKFRDTYTFRGIVNGTYHGTCCQCLASAAVPFSVQVRWIFEETSGSVLREISRTEEESEYLSPEQVEEYFSKSAQERVINLAPYVWEEVVFAEPYTFVCSEECKGICGHCGANLNKHQCGCEEKKASQQRIDNPGLAALAKFYPQLAPDKDKE